MKKDEKLVLWTERLKTFQASGQTCKEWCQEHQHAQWGHTVGSGTQKL